MAEPSAGPYPRGEHEQRGPEPEPDHWFEQLASHLQGAYLRYSFTKGTVQEVDALERWLGLAPGARVLDVGCGPGRHANELGRRGYEVVGVDISADFVAIAAAAAPPGVTFRRLDARALPFEQEFDAVISLCQGAFGLSGGPAVATGPGTPDPDLAVLRGMAGALRPGGRLALSAFSAYFQVRELDEPEAFDADAGVNHEHTSVKDPAGTDLAVELWTTCFTPRELRLMVAACGLEVRALWSVEPGRYTERRPTVELPEFLVVAAAPS